MATKTIEKRVSDSEEQVGDIPRLLNLRFEYVRAQLDMLDARVSTVEAKIDRVETRLSSVETRLSGVETRLSSVEGKIDALPRVLAEMLDEREKRSK
jgi:chromosome segregation ATPase